MERKTEGGREMMIIIKKRNKKKERQPAFFYYYLFLSSRWVKSNKEDVDRRKIEDWVFFCSFTEFPWKAKKPVDERYEDEVQLKQ